jgi:hypothetical protein
MRDQFKQVRCCLVFGFEFGFVRDCLSGFFLVNKKINQ